jgi:hypothetical protein
MNLMDSAVRGMAFGIVDARRKKSINRLMATPMPQRYYLLSFVFSRLVLLAVEVGAVLGSAVLVFQVPVRASERSSLWPSLAARHRPIAFPLSTCST